MKRELELYIHIPFCMKKCAYCDFLSGPAPRETIDRYVTALVAEIRQYQKLAENYRVTTIFFWRRNTIDFVGRSDERNF